MKTPSKTTIALQFIAGIVVCIALLFGVAGTWNWPEAWIYLIIQFTFSGIMATYLLKNDPSLLQKRMAFDIPKELWDKFIMLSIVIFSCALFIMPALDVRYGWSSVPLIVKTISFLLIAWSLHIIFLTLKENSYLAKIVVIQKGHKVISTGPYAKVRHPMYVGAIILFVALPLALNSVYSIIPGLIVALTLIIRTSLEDKRLHKELKGYKAYAKKVKYKLIPGVW